jgi:hypothetical protein
MILLNQYYLSSLKGAQSLEPLKAHYNTGPHDYTEYTDHSRYFLAKPLA